MDILKIELSKKIEITNFNFYEFYQNYKGKKGIWEKLKEFWQNYQGKKGILEIKGRNLAI